MRFFRGFDVEESLLSVQLSGRMADSKRLEDAGRMRIRVRATVSAVERRGTGKGQAPEETGA
ncbi:MAG: hypothetical protein J4F39_05780 [Candidatus Latescibacteria bacterium]|nr:hypothetical protein [Candidatus Latescibacterota bacterium]